MNSGARVIAEAMLQLVDARAAVIEQDRDRVAVTIVGAMIVFDGSLSHPFERLASAVEARVAYERACAMIAAAGEAGAPLWLVTGSALLGAWLTWSRTETMLAKVLALTDRTDAAPVAGELSRRARRDLGQMAMKIRVRAGQAVAERIELSQRVPAILILGERAHVRIARQHLPDTLLVALQDDPSRNDRRRAGELLDHPFFAAHDIMIAGVRQDGGDVIVELETDWAPLAPIPKAAWTVVPRGADHRFPWRLTAREVAELYDLARRGESLLVG